MSENPYLGRITSGHARAPKFGAVIDALTSPLVDIQALLERIRRAFDLDTAEGVQLDGVGLWVGRTRKLKLALTDVYFTWDANGLGWSGGVWRGLYDPETGLVSLPDDIYRTLLKAKVAANAWDGTRDGAYDVWEAAFADQGSIILIQDNQDMSIGIGIAGIPPSAVLEALLVQGYIPLKPEGVRVSWYAIAPGETGSIFAWNCDSDALAGWDKGGWPRILEPNRSDANAA